MASGGGSRPKRWQHDAASGHRIVRAQTTEHGRLSKKVGKGEAESRSGLAIGRSGNFGNVVRPRSVSVLEPSAVDPGDETWDTSIDLNVEDTEDVERAQPYATPEFIYDCPF